MLFDLHRCQFGMVISQEFLQGETLSLMLYHLDLEEKLDVTLDALCCFEQIMEAALYEIAVWPLTAYLTNHS